MLPLKRHKTVLCESIPEQRQRQLELTCVHDFHGYRDIPKFRAVRPLSKRTGMLSIINVNVPPNAPKRQCSTDAERRAKEMKRGRTMGDILFGTMAWASPVLWEIR